MRLLFLNILLILSASMYAQEHKLSLAESKKAALEYSRSIKNGLLTIESAYAGKKGAEANYYPSLSATGVGLYGFKDFIGAVPPLLTKGVNNFYFAGVAATQVIYNGGKIKTGNELAAMQLEVSRIRAEQSRDSVLLLTEQKYWDLVTLQEQDKVLQANEKLLNEIVKQQEDMISAGLIAKNDLLKVKVQLSRLLLEKSKLDNAHKVALLDFCFYIGRDYDAALLMIDSIDTSAIPLLGMEEPVMDLYVNTNYQLLQKSLESEKLQTKYTKADYMPSVMVGVSAAQVGAVDNSVIGSNFMPIAFGTVSIPISDWWGAGKQKLKQRELTEKIALNRFADGENQIKVGIMKAWYDVNDAYKQITFAKENLEQATENLKVNQDNYASGLSSITDLLDAQAFYQQAQSEHNIAHNNFYNKKAAYQYIIGTLK